MVNSEDIYVEHIISSKTISYLLPVSLGHFASNRASLSWIKLKVPQVIHLACDNSNKGLYVLGIELPKSLHAQQHTLMNVTIERKMAKKFEEMCKKHCTVYFLSAMLKLINRGLIKVVTGECTNLVLSLFALLSESLLTRNDGQIFVRLSLM